MENRSLTEGSCPDCGETVEPVTQMRQQSTQAGLPAEATKKILSRTTIGYRCNGCHKGFTELPNPKTLRPFHTKS